MKRAVFLVSIALMLGPAPTVALADGFAGRYQAALELRRRQPADFGPSPGLLVIQVEPQSPAAGLGIEAGDVWVAYQGRPIAGVQPFLEDRAAPDSSGELRFLRNGAPQTLTLLPPGRLGAGLLELAEHGLAPTDAETLFALLEAGFAGERDALMALVRERATALETIRQHLAEAAETDRPGAAQLRAWADSLGTFLDLDRQRAQLEEKQVALDAERLATEQALAQVRTDRYHLEFLDLIRQSEMAAQAGQHALAAERAEAATVLARQWSAALPAAATPLQRALPLVFEGHALNIRANALANRGEHAPAVRAAGAALVVARDGAVLARTAVTPELASERDKLLALADGVENLSLDLLALSHSLLEDWPAARAVLEERLPRARGTGDIPGQIDAHRQLGTVLLETGDYPAAHDHLTAALALLEGRADPERSTMIHSTLSRLFQELGEPRAAVEHGELALAEARRLAHREPGATGVAVSLPGWSVERELLTHNALGSLYSFWLGRPRSGREQFRQAAALAAQHLPADDPRRSIALTGLVASETMAGDLAAALSHAEEALALVRRDPAFAAARLLGRRTEAAAAVAAAEVLISRREFDRAETYLREAVAAAPDDTGYVPLAVPEARARMRLLADDPAAAEPLLRENLARIDHLRADQSTTEQARIALADLYSTNFDLLQHALLAQGREDDALALLEERRGRTLFAQVGAGAGIASRDAAGMRALARETGATLVFYALAFAVEKPLVPGRLSGYQPDAERELLIWVVRPHGQTVLRRRPLPAPLAGANGLGAGVGALMAAMAPSAPDAAPADPAPLLRGFHELLIGSIGDLLPAPGRHLVFLPDGPLLSLPFAALRDHAGHYLIERHPIVVVPTLKLLDLAARSAVPPAPEAGPAGALIVGDPRVASRLRGLFEDLAPLPHARAEAEAIGTLLHARPLLGEAATRQAVLERMPAARWLHLASHALLKDREALAQALPAAVHGIGEPPGALVLSPVPGDYGLLGAGEIMRQPLTAELAVLSACNTGRGRVTSDGIWGLPYAFVRAGVPRVVVSLWAVDDASTEVLMPHLYRVAADGVSLAEALRQAMLRTIAAGYAEPRQWAAFVMMGRW